MTKAATPLVPPDVEVMTDKALAKAIKTADRAGWASVRHLQLHLEQMRRYNLALLAFGSETWQYAMQALGESAASKDAYVESPEAKRGAELVEDFRLACVNAWLMG